MNAWTLSIKKMQDGKELLILFDDNRMEAFFQSTHCTQFEEASYS